ncbi:RrF2 family transcriptional regulator [Parvularcula bermudensis]|nr:Rrf2 family transcriptional regulator [Parvularcula bermudensis]
MISQKAKYALRAMVLLARAHAEDEALIIADISERQNIPKKFLEQILLDLKRHGLLDSRRGKNGGYMLLRPADQITFGEVLRIIEGPIAPLPCLSKMAYRKCEDCDGEKSCEIRRVFAEVADATRAVLDKTTIADAIADERLAPANLRGKARRR